MPSTTAPDVTPLVRAYEIRGAIRDRLQDVSTTMCVLDRLVGEGVVSGEHTNPCWVALNDEACYLGIYLRAFEADPIAALAANPDLTVAGIMHGLPNAATRLRDWGL